MFLRPRIFIVFALTLTGFLVQAFAQAPALPGLLEGSVVNKITGAPVRHAQVMCARIPAQNDSPVSAETDADGRFSIPVEAGSYRLWVERPGFVDQVFGSRTSHGPGAVLTLTAGQQVRDVNFRLVPLGAIAGRVLDEEGEPLQSAAIQVLRFSFSTGRRILIPVSGASSNDRGEYRIYGLAAGRYFLMATPRGMPVARPLQTGAFTPEIREPFAASYYPGVPDFASASQITLPEGGEFTDADFHMRRIRAVTVRGRIFSPVENFANSQLQVVLAHNEGNVASFIDRMSATVDGATGRFEFRGVAPGAYLLIAAQLYQGHALGGRLPIEVNTATSQQNISLALSPSSDIVGNVEIEGTSPVKLQRLTVHLSPAENLALGPHPVSRVGPDGAIRLPGVTPGIWDLTIDSSSDDLWTRTATLGGMDVSHGELSIGSGQRAQLHIVLAGNGAQISGSVKRDGQPVQAAVVLVPAAADLQNFPRMYGSTATQEQGAFVFKGVRPGAYKLFAFEEVEMFAWLDPEFLKPVESLGESISVSEGDRVTKQLTPIPPDALLTPR